MTRIYKLGKDIKVENDIFSDDSYVYDFKNGDVVKVRNGKGLLSKLRRGLSMDEASQPAFRAIIRNLLSFKMLAVA